MLRWRVATSVEVLSSLATIASSVTLASVETVSTSKRWHQLNRWQKQTKPIDELYSYQVGNRHKVVCKPCDDGWLDPLWDEYHFTQLFCSYDNRWLSSLTHLPSYHSKSPYNLTIAASNNMYLWSWQTKMCQKATQLRLYPFSRKRPSSNIAPKSQVCNNCDLSLMWSSRCHRRCKRLIKVLYFDDWLSFYQSQYSPLKICDISVDLFQEFLFFLLHVLPKWTEINDPLC